MLQQQPALAAAGIAFAATSAAASAAASDWSCGVSPLIKAARCSEGFSSVSAAVRRKPPLLYALESELYNPEAPPTLLSLSRSVNENAGQSRV